MQSSVLGPAVLVSLLSIVGCGSTHLEPWHTAKLSDEFVSADAATIRSFEDYRRLEEKLFRSLAPAVYAHVDTGPSRKFNRYSAGSAADPEHQQPNWNRSFELIPETPIAGVLLLHGMSDSPYSFRALGKTLAEQDYRVVGLRLPGHGTAPSALKHVSLPDMAAAVRLGMRHLASAVGEKPIHIVGYSTGAALALDFALDALDGDASPAPASLVLVSPAIRISPVAALARFKSALSILPGLGGLAWLQIVPEFDPYKYNSFATNAGAVVHRITRSVDRRIASLTNSDSAERMPPILVFKSTVDATVTTRATIDRLLARLPPKRNALVLFDINRSAANSSLLVSDPGPLTARLMADDTLPFSLTLVTNEHSESDTVVARHKAPLSATSHDETSVGLAWPAGALSLSHVALPIPPDDPLHGQVPPDGEAQLFLGGVALRAERGLVVLPADWQLRMRYNPFYEIVERRVLEWFASANLTTGD